MDEANVGKGASIGTGAGLGVGFIAAAILASQCEACPPHGFALFPLGGAVVRLIDYVGSEGVAVGGCKLEIATILSGDAPVA
jgi:hypothetical protein